MGGTLKKGLLWGAGLIGLYLAVNYYTGFSKDLSTAGTGSVNLIKAFQGR
jgi:hypothetical protein